MAEESSSVFREDRSWMYTGRRSRDSITPEWAEKTTEFVERAFRRVPPDHAARGVLCPCARCGNARPRSRYDMQMHLCKNGFRPGYTVWVYHGESHSHRRAESPDDHDDDNGDLDGNKDAELADFLGENGVPSKPQGAMKREISLIQAYAYSKLRKEDQIEWNYQKYLWEKEKLWQQSAPRLLEELKRQRLEAERRALKAERQLVEQREIFERRAKQFQAYEDFMANLSNLQARLQDGTPLALPPMPQMPHATNANIYDTPSFACSKHIGINWVE